MTQSINDILADVKVDAHVPTATVTVLLGSAQQMLDQHTALDQRLAEAMVYDTSRAKVDVDGDLNDVFTPTAPAIAAEIRDLEVAIEEAGTEFTFKSIGRRRWQNLIAAHPPTDADKAQDRTAEINGRTFPIAAVAASCVDPEMSDEQAEELAEHLNNSQWEQLFQAALDVNVGRIAVPKSLAAGTTLRLSEQFGTTAANTESPDPSSLDE